VGTPDELVEAFSAAVPFALHELAGVEAVIREVGPATSGGATAELAAVVRLALAGREAQLILSFPQRTAEELAQRILAESGVSLTTDLVRDCIGEVANVVSGQAKALLVGSPSHFSLSTPTVRPGAAADEADGRVIWFESDAGGFTVRLCTPV
jgi:CheY-specific phosphatase CheX